MSFTGTVLDTLLPGDAGKPAPLPKGSRVVADLSADASRLIADEAGGEAAFIAASAEARVDILRRVEKRSPSAFQAMLAPILLAYYQAPEVMTAMGGRATPPQPQGNVLAATDAATWERLEKVKARGRIWR